MANITKKFNFTGWARPLDQIIAANATYQAGLIKSIVIVSNNAAVAYVHLNDSATQPSTATDGVPLSNAAATAPSSALTLENVDLTGLWINVPGAAMDIVYMVNGNR